MKPNTAILGSGICFGSLKLKMIFNKILRQEAYEWIGIFKDRLAFAREVAPFRNTSGISFGQFHSIIIDQKDEK